MIKALIFDLDNCIADDHCEPLRSFGDEGCIKELGAQAFLVTCGDTEEQGLKIDELGLADIFDQIVIIDKQEDQDLCAPKLEVFSKLLDERGWSAGEVMVIGDDAESELAAAQKLGIQTIQTLRPGVKKWNQATYHVTSLYQLKGIVGAMRA